MQSVLREVFLFFFKSQKKSSIIHLSCFPWSFRLYGVPELTSAFYFSFNDHTKSLIWPHVILTSFSLMMEHFTDIRAVSALWTY